MVKRWLSFVVMSAILLLSLILVFSASAHGQGDILLSNLWVRPAAEGEVSALYMHIENPGNHSIRLVAANTDRAEVVELHETTMQNGVMSMAALEEGIIIGAGNSMTLAPGGLHIMLIGLVDDLPLNSALSITLTFEVDDEGTLLDVVVAAPVLEEAPDNSPDLLVINSWARPTALMDMAEMTETAGTHSHGHGHSHGDDNDHNHAEMGNLPPSAAYMMLTNRGDAADTLIAVSSPLIPVVELHISEIENDVMRMRALPDGISIPAGESVVLQPGGLHLMLLNLEADLLPGDAIPMTLIFESGRELIIAVPVRDELEMDMGMHHGHGHNHGG